MNGHLRTGLLLNAYLGQEAARPSAERIACTACWAFSKYAYYLYTAKGGLTLSNGSCEKYTDLAITTEEDSCHISSSSLHLQRARALKHDMIICGTVVTACTAHGHGHRLLAGIAATGAAVVVLRWQFPELGQINLLNLDVARDFWCSKKGQI